MRILPHSPSHQMNSLQCTIPGPFTSRRTLNYTRAPYLQNILVKVYLDSLMPCPVISPFLDDKQASFTKYLTIHGHHAFQKANTISTITRILEHYNYLVTLNQSVQSSHPSHHSVIVGIQYDPISYEDQLHKPIK